MERALRLFESSPSCGQRQSALLPLKRYGDNEKVHCAIRQAGERMPANLFLMLDLIGAEQAVRARLQ